MRNTTILYILRNKKDNIGKEILLAYKKRGLGEGKYNGTGGKQEEKVKR